MSRVILISLASLSVVYLRSKTSNSTAVDGHNLMNKVNKIQELGFKNKGEIMLRCPRKIIHGK